MTNPNSKLKTSLTSAFKDLLSLNSDIPHYYEVHFQNHPNGLEKVHCGTVEDVERTLSMHPTALVTQVFPPQPQVVNVNATSLGNEEALKEAAKSLPESESIKLEL
jgi:hypothetical protein